MATSSPVRCDVSMRMFAIFAYKGLRSPTIWENAFLGFFVLSNGRSVLCEALAKSVFSLPSSHTIKPSRFKISTFSLRSTIPPPVTMTAGCIRETVRSVSVSALRNFFSPCLEKISGIDIPRFETTISSVSRIARPVRRCRQRPTEDLPEPIMPTRTIDRPTRFTLQYLIKTWFRPVQFLPC
jgi:hypothetical protein